MAATIVKTQSKEIVATNQRNEILVWINPKILPYDLCEFGTPYSYPTFSELEEIINKNCTSEVTNGN